MVIRRTNVNSIRESQPNIFQENFPDVYQIQTNPPPPKYEEIDIGQSVHGSRPTVEKQTDAANDLPGVNNDMQSFNTALNHSDDHEKKDSKF